jgi:hypothetical protein
LQEVSAMLSEFPFLTLLPQLPPSPSTQQCPSPTPACRENGHARSLNTILAHLQSQRPGNGQPSNGQPSNGQPGNGQPSNGQPSNGRQYLLYLEDDWVTLPVAERGDTGPLTWLHDAIAVLQASQQPDSGRHALALKNMIPYAVASEWMGQESICDVHTYNNICI